MFVLFCRLFGKATTSLKNLIKKFGGKVVENFADGKQKLIAKGLLRSHRRSALCPLPVAMQ